MSNIPLSVSYKMAGEWMGVQMAFNFSLLAWLVFATLIMFAVFSLLNSLFFSISKGSEARFHHLGVGGPIVVYLILYAVQQLVSVVALLLIPLGIQITNPAGQLPEFSLVYESSLSMFNEMLSGADSNTAVIGIEIVPVAVLFSFLLLVLTINSHRRHTSVR